MFALNPVDSGLKDWRIKGGTLLYQALHVYYYSDAARKILYIALQFAVTFSFVFYFSATAAGCAAAASRLSLCMMAGGGGWV